MAVRSRVPASFSETDREVLKQFQVRAMAAAATEIRVIADFLGISVSQLRRDYKDELKSGGNWLKNTIEIGVARKALGGDVRCMLAWLRQYGGWTEVTRKEITGAKGEPISFRHLDGPSLDQIVKALREAGDATSGARRDSAPTISIGAEGVRDLESIPWTPDEGTEE
jgi:DNA-binding Lrp family transcriptional regulator